ncbi:Neuraminidase [Mycena indigotica]|uniref:Neuraminidase n=1 Tax=Mycena indigotica TaxID=2126181 RepID=A0A8H6WIX4_9AGAR|nr:Neuraminidase [Mycena indigotica]KAF7316578.1 Neuraminidase [Mycena indigotica]
MPRGLYFPSDNRKTWKFLPLMDQRTPTAANNGLWVRGVHVSKNWAIQVYYAAENSASDQDISVRSSTNNGATWSAATTVAGGGTILGRMEAARISPPQAARRGFDAYSRQQMGQHRCLLSSRSSAATTFRGEHRSMRQPELAILLAWRSPNCSHAYGNSGRIVHDRRGAFGEEAFGRKGLRLRLPGLRLREDYHRITDYQTLKFLVAERAAGETGVEKTSIMTTSPAQHVSLRMCSCFAPVLALTVKQDILRYYPFLPLAGRIAVEDSVLLLLKLVITKFGASITQFKLSIQKGQDIHLALASYPRRNPILGKDAHEFRPSRWMEAEPPGNGLKLVPFESISIGA